MARFEMGCKSAAMGYQETYERSLSDPAGFWGEAAALIDWEESPSVVLDDSDAPLYRWFTGGVMNTCHNALDRACFTSQLPRGERLREQTNHVVRPNGRHHLSQEVEESEKFFAWHHDRWAGARSWHGGPSHRMARAQYGFWLRRSAVHCRNHRRFDSRPHGRGLQPQPRFGLTDNGLTRRQRQEEPEVVGRCWSDGVLTDRHATARADDDEHPKSGLWVAVSNPSGRNTSHDGPGPDEDAC